MAYTPCNLREGTMAGEKEINELLDRLLEGRSAEKVVGDGGLLADLTKRLMERVLEAELTDHLGYEKHTAEETMAAFEERFPMISRKWRANWANMTPFFDYPPKIRKVLYTTNVI